jgi:hypothetical protein
MHVRDTAFLNVVIGNLTPVGAMQSLTDAARQVKVVVLMTIPSVSSSICTMRCRGLDVLIPLLVAYQLQDFLLAFLDESAAQAQEAGRVLILHSLTGRTHVLMGSCGALRPCPAPMVVHRAAPRANRRLRQLTLRFIEVMDAFVNEAVLAMRSRGWTHGLFFPSQLLPGHFLHPAVFAVSSRLALR